MSKETKFDWTRVDNDVNGNPRYVCHYTEIASTYEAALAVAKKFGGRKFHNKQYGGGIVFGSYVPEKLEDRLIEASPKYIRQKEDKVIEVINSMGYGYELTRISGRVYLMGHDNYDKSINELFDLAINTDEGIYHDAIKLLCQDKYTSKAIKTYVGSYRYDKIMNND